MAINWDPTAVEEVTQNVATLIRTASGSVPLTRAMGTPQNIVDTPLSAVGARLQADVIRAVRTYEPRVRVKRVRLSVDADGTLQAITEIVEP